jgi:hypothetical protein
MPQLDFLSYFVQIIWFSIFSFEIYILYLTYFIKNISETVKMRAKIKNFASSNFKYNIFDLIVLDFFKKN